MAILISAHELSKSFGSRQLFKGLTFSIESGDRIGLIGPNGAGKSTLLKILANKSELDGGKLSMQKGLRVGYLEQVPQFKPEATVLASILENSHDPYDWQEILKAQSIMGKLSLNTKGIQESTLIKKLSGGWRRRVALARELFKDPDLLLLDEPTNHLDVESILWLEALLEKSSFSTITITHDRVFLQNVSKSIFELDKRHPDGLLKIDGDYIKYLEVRQDLLNAQEKQETKLKNTLRRETEWLRRGAKARTTKQQARIKGAAELADQVADLSERNKKSIVQMDFQGAEKNPKKLAEAKNISKSYSGKMVIPPIDLLITPQTRLGLIGANGCGKSTLIRLLTDLEKPDTGSVFHAERLEISYFEQNRESLDPELSVFKTVCPNGDFVSYAGQMVHAKSYLSRFLFTFEQMDMPVRKLSGGEQSRLLLARLMLKKANLLVLDEPTNDLDISTLDVLEEVLQEFNGAIILVTHDRYFLDQVSNKLLAFGIDESGNKKIEPMVGMEQWQEWYREQLKFFSKLKSTAIVTQDEKPSELSKKKKLTYKDQRELDGMEENIQKAENLVEELTQESLRPENATSSKKMIELTKKLAQAQAEVERLYNRWSELTGDEN